MVVTLLVLVLVLRRDSDGTDWVVGRLVAVEEEDSVMLELEDGS